MVLGNDVSIWPIAVIRPASYSFDMVCQNSVTLPNATFLFDERQFREGHGRWVVITNNSTETAMEGMGVFMNLLTFARAIFLLFISTTSLTTLADGSIIVKK